MLYPKRQGNSMNPRSSRDLDLEILQKISELILNGIRLEVVLRVSNQFVDRILSFNSIDPLPAKLFSIPVGLLHYTHFTRNSN